MNPNPIARGLAHAGGGENGAASPDLREQPMHEQIAACARELWRKYGCPVGRDEQIWLEAERQLLGADANISRVGGSGSADALNQAAPRSTATPGGAVKSSGKRSSAQTAVSPSPASSGL